MKSLPLYPFQEKINSFCATKNRVGIFTFYGSGKTYLSLQWLENRSKTEKMFPVLVFTLKSLVPQWVNQIQLHSSYTVRSVTGTAKQRLAQLQKEAEIYVINYDAIRSKPLLKFLQQATFNTIIADESTALKEARTKRSSLIIKLFKTVLYKALLSGKPITEDPIEIWSQMLFLDNGASFGSSFWKFRHTYFTPGPPWRPYDWDLKIGANKAIGKILSKRCIYLRKEDILHELPLKHYNRIHFKMPSVLKKIYTDFKRNFQVKLPSGKILQTKWAMVKGGKLHQICNGFVYTVFKEASILDSTKLDWLKDNILSMLHTGPVLIWSCFLAQLVETKLLLDSMEIGVEYYHGGLSSSKRNEIEQDFQKGKFDVLLLSQGAAYAGLNLQRACHSIFLSTSYHASWRANAEDRCHRLGSEQHSSIEYYDLLMENSIDEVVLKAIEKKESVSAAILKHIKEKE